MNMLVRLKGLLTSKRRLFFFAAFAIFFILQMYITLVPFVQRQALVEPDDAYSYILKAEEMRTCFWQDCPALGTLREQLLFSTGDEVIGYHQYRQYHRVFEIYHPLHSLLLSGLNVLGVSYEVGYLLLVAGFKSLLCIAIAYFLLTLFGELPTALALCMLAPITYTGTGIHTIVPSSMTLAIAILLWALIAKRHRKAPIYFIPLALVMMLMHTIGTVYSGVALGLYVVLNLAEIKGRRKLQIFVLSAGVLVGLSLVDHLLVSAIELSAEPVDFYPVEWSVGSQFVNANIPNLQNVLSWAGAFAFPIFGLSLLAYGVYCAYSERRKSSLGMLTLLVLLALVSTVYITPWFLTVVFERAFVPLAILCAGFIAYGIVRATEQIYQGLREWRVKKWKLSSLPRHPSNVIAVVILGIFILGIASTYIPFYSRHYQETLESQVTRKNYSLNPDQPQIALAGDEKTVLYTHEIPLYYYLSNGGLQHKAVYLPAVKGSAQEAEWLNQKSIDYVVTSNPVVSSGTSAITSLVITTSGNTKASIINLYVSNPGDAVSLQFYGEDSAAVTSQQIPANYNGWVQVADANPAARIVISAGSPFSLLGLRLTPDQSTFWPWDQGVYLDFSSNEEGAQALELSTGTLVPGLPFEIEVVDDLGGTILARVMP